MKLILEFLVVLLVVVIVCQANEESQHVERRHHRRSTTPPTTGAVVIEVKRNLANEELQHIDRRHHHRHTQSTLPTTETFFTAGKRNLPLERRFRARCSSTTQAAIQVRDNQEKRHRVRSFRPWRTRTPTAQTSTPNSASN